MTARYLVSLMRRDANAIVAEAGAKAIEYRIKKVYAVILFFLILILYFSRCKHKNPTIGLSNELIAAGAIPLLIATLEHHKTNARVCESVCSALCSVSKSDLLKHEMTAAGIIPQLVDTIVVHKAHRDVCAEAICVLLSLACIGSLRSRIVLAGGVPALAIVGKNHIGRAGSEATALLQVLGNN